MATLFVARTHLKNVLEVPEENLVADSSDDTIMRMPNGFPVPKTWIFKTREEAEGFIGARRLGKRPWTYYGFRGLAVGGELAVAAKDKRRVNNAANQYKHRMKAQGDKWDFTVAPTGDGNFRLIRTA